MDVRNLLELAAKAADVDYDRSDGRWIGLWWISESRRWNPITNDGDALQLLVKCRMTVAWEPMRGGWSVGAIVGGEFKWLAFDEDCRLAIVMAAAQVSQISEAA